MRVLVLGPVFPDSFARNVAVTLQDMGHDVRALGAWRPPDWLPYAARHALMAASRRGWIGGGSRPLLSTVRRFDAELVLNCYTDLSPEAVAHLRRQSGSRLVAWFPDHVGNLQRQYLVAAPYHAVFSKSPTIVHLLRQQVGSAAFHLPECCNPKWHRRVTLTASEQALYSCEVATAGNLYYYRAHVLEALSDHDLKIWGTGFPPWLESPLRRRHQGRFVAELEKAKALNAAKIVVNTLHPAEVGSVNARLFETAGCGAFQITEHRDCLAEYFEPETEVVTFRSRRELKEKVEYYLAHDTERRAIADRAYARAHRDHTYEKRLQELLSVVAAQPR